MDDKIDPTDLLVGMAEVLHELTAWMVMSGVISPAKMKGLIEIAIRRVEKERPGAAEAIRAQFPGVLDGEWAQMAQLASNSDKGSA